MSLTILAAEVFDPALSDDYDTAPRLEIALAEMPDEPTWVELNKGQYTIMHRNWLSSIFSDDPDWDDEDTELCAAQFNSSLVGESREPVMPITVAGHDASGQVWQDYYVKLSRVRRILNRLAMEKGGQPYEVVPNGPMVEDHMFSWTLMHPERMCVKCIHEVMLERVTEFCAIGRNVFTQESELKKVQRGCSLVQVRPYRQVPMCSKHTAAWNYEHMQDRVKENR